MKKDVLVAIAAVVAILAIAYGLSAVHPAVAPTVAPAASATATSTAPPGADNVVMRVNGEAVTEREFAYFVSSLPEQMQAFFTNPAGRRQIAEQYVRMKVLEQEATRLGADKDPGVTARMKFGHTNLAVDYALQKIAGDASDAQLRAEYDKNRGKYAVTDLRHILVAYQGGRIPSTHGAALPPDQAMERAKKILAELRAGADFAATARKESDDSGSGAQGGLIGAVPRGSLPPDMERVVEPLQPGQLSEPVRSEFGIHIFRVDSRHPQSFEEVKALLKQQFQQSTVNDAVTRLQKGAHVELDPKYFPAAPATTPPKG
jgi:parvulin-like peptidyl-prolyl isomerase